MSVMLRFIDEVYALVIKLRQSESAYTDGLNDAALVAGGSKGGGKIVYMPNSGGTAIELEVDDEVRRALLEKAIVVQVNEHVDKMGQLWRAVINQADEALSVIDAASAKVASTEAAGKASEQPPVATQSVSQAVVQPVATSPAPAAATIPVVPSRVRRISREE